MRPSTGFPDPAVEEAWQRQYEPHGLSKTMLLLAFGFYRTSPRALETINQRLLACGLVTVPGLVGTGPYEKIGLQQVEGGSMQNLLKEQILAELVGTDLENLTPLAAHQRIAEWQTRFKASLKASRSLTD